MYISLYATKSFVCRILYSGNESVEPIFQNKHKKLQSDLFTAAAHIFDSNPATNTHLMWPLKESHFAKYAALRKLSFSHVLSLCIYRLSH